MIYIDPTYYRSKTVKDLKVKNKLKVVIEGSIRGIM